MGCVADTDAAVFQVHKNRSRPTAAQLSSGAFANYVLDADNGILGHTVEQTSQSNNSVSGSCAVNVYANVARINEEKPEEERVSAPICLEGHHL